MHCRNTPGYSGIVSEQPSSKGDLDKKIVFDAAYSRIPPFASITEPVM